MKKVYRDNIREYLPLTKYLLTKGAIFVPIPLYTKELNSITEIRNRYLLELLVAIMSEY